MKLLIDTSVLIDVLRGHEGAVAFVHDAATRDDELWSVTMVRTEVLAGMRPREQGPTMALLDALRWIDVTVDLAEAAGALARKYLRSHPGVDVTDYLLAAAAQRLEARPCTTNLRHFPMFPNLEAPYA
ncbi:MAG: PIN domain-containing protein [Acidobacteria bacterium]|nr:PIN domain-containing protein [Acidobacteriota bacterium]